MVRVEANKNRKDLYQAHKYIAKNLKLMRNLKGISQEKIAAMLHMSRSCYSCLESGTKTPDFMTIYTLSKFYDINLDYLLSFDISEQILTLLKNETNETDPSYFMEKYIQLSDDGKLQIYTRIEELLSMEQSFNHYPWDYRD